MSEVKQETAEYSVLSKFAKYKAGEIITLAVPCPDAARAHVRLYLGEPKPESELKKELEVAMSMCSELEKELAALKAENEKLKASEKTLEVATPSPDKKAPKAK